MRNIYRLLRFFIIISLIGFAFSSCGTAGGRRDFTRQFVWTVDVPTTYTLASVGIGAHSLNGHATTHTIQRLMAGAADPDHTHIWGVWAVVSPATCIAPAIEVRTCNCGATETRDSETQLALGHLNNSWNWATYNSTTGHVNCTRTGCIGGFASIGDTGPGGGIIFFVADGLDGRHDGFTFYTGMGEESETRFYLEADPENAVGTQQWAVGFGLIPGI